MFAAIVTAFTATLVRLRIDPNHPADWLRYLRALEGCYPDNVIRGITGMARYAPQAIWDAANAGNAYLPADRMEPAGPRPPETQVGNHGLWKYINKTRKFEADSDTLVMALLSGTMSPIMYAKARGNQPDTIHMKPWTIIENIAQAAGLPLSSEQASRIMARMAYTNATSDTHEEDIDIWAGRVIIDFGTLGNAGHLNGWAALLKHMRLLMAATNGGNELFKLYFQLVTIPSEHFFTVETFLAFIIPKWPGRERPWPTLSMPAPAAAAALAAAVSPLATNLIAAAQAPAPYRTQTTVANRLGIANGANNPNPTKPATVHSNYCFLHGWTSERGHIGASCNNLKKDRNSTAAMKAALAPVILPGKDRVNYVGCSKVL